jgi:Flp pilus assembly protein TadG
MMKTRPSALNTARDPSGQTMVEFALVASVFLLLLFAIMQVALAVYNYNTVCSVAREAVRYAMVHSPSSTNPASDSQIQQIAVNNAVGLDSSRLTVTVSWPANASLPLQKDAQVKVSYQYQLNIPFMAPLSLTFASTSEMLVSQ